MAQILPSRRTTRRAALMSAACAAFVAATPDTQKSIAEVIPVADRPIRSAALSAARLGGGKPVTTFEGGTRDWDDFKRRFITADGRIVDTGNGGCSHTEGQGVGMLFAVGFDDLATFERIFDWTSRHLRRPSDSLHGWRYLPNAPTPVSDWNNATDGDLYIAASLLRAARRWNRPDYFRAAAAMSGDILTLLVRTVGGRTVLLPGAFGFEAADSVTVNPSYYIFPLMAELAEAFPSAVWNKVIADGIALIEDGRFGKWKLPPDWLHVARADGALQPHPHWPTRFSYDAIRVPLFLAWGRVTSDDASRAFHDWARANPVQPAWVDLRTNATAGYGASPGMTAIAHLTDAARSTNGVVATQVRFPAVATNPDYYSASLSLLSRLAWQESRTV